MRITIALILALILTIIVAIFAIQNNIAINITFLAWSIDGSLALILIITFALGIVLGLLVSTPIWIKKTRQSSTLKKNLRVLEKDLEAARQASAASSRVKPDEVPCVEITTAEEPETEMIENASNNPEIK